MSAADGGLRAHGRRVEALMREVPLVPVPPGLAARDEEAVRRFLRRARLPLLEALELTEGCWELRVHLLRRREGTRGSGDGSPGGPAGGGEDGPGASSRDDAAAGGELPAGASGLARALRRRCRAVRSLPPPPGVVLSRACLVPRPRWIALVEEVARREEGLAGLEADVTGPWAPWDFVRLFREGGEETP